MEDKEKYKSLSKTNKLKIKKIIDSPETVSLYTVNYLSPMRMFSMNTEQMIKTENR